MEVVMDTMDVLQKAEVGLKLEFNNLIALAASLLSESPRKLAILQELSGLSKSATLELRGQAR
jgi:hypothetical protein